VVNSVAINPYKVAAPFRQFFRRRRFRGFFPRYDNCRTIVDVGGDHSLWTQVLGRTEGVTIVNVWFPEVSQGFRYILGDGCQLPIGDKSVDLAFSNSAIEHVGDFERQRRFAAELMRIGKTIYCQTPCRLFPVDPHLGTPFVHWLPRRCLTSKFLRYFTLNGWLVRKGYEYDVTWLSRNQLQAIFPGCDIKTERFLGLPKSFIITSPS
jgi:Methyltransferase domain